MWKFVQAKWIVIVAASCMQATISTAMSLVLGFCLLACSTVFSARRVRALYAACGMLSLMPTKVIAMSVLLAYHLSGMGGIILAHSILNGAFVFFVLYRAYAHIDYHLLWVAVQLGASWKGIYCVIPFSLLKHTMYATGVLIFILCFSSYSIPFLLAHNWYEHTLDIVASQLYQSGHTGLAGGYMVLRACILMPLWWFCEYHTNVSSFMQNLSHRPFQVPRVAYQSSAQKGIIVVLGMGCVILIFYPILYLIWYAQGNQVANIWYRFFCESSFLIGTISFWWATFNTVASAFLSSMLALFFGALLSYVYNKENSFLYVSMTAIGSSSLLVGSLWCEIIFSSGQHYTWCGPLFRMVICQFLLNIPFICRLITSRLQDYQQEWSYVSQSYGASSCQQWCLVMLPFVRPALYQGWGICFGLSLTESTAFSVMVQQGWITLPIASKLLYQNGDHMQALALILLLMAASFVVHGCYIYRRHV